MTRAIRRAHLVVTVPNIILLVGPVIYVFVVDPSPGAVRVYGAIASALATAWCYRMIAVPLWRRSAYRAVAFEDFGALRVQAMWAGLAWPPGHLLERAEWKSGRQRREERQLEAQYLEHYRRWPEVPSYHETPEEKIRFGARAIMVVSVGALTWRLVSPDHFAQVKPNSLLLYLGTLSVALSVLLWKNPISERAFAQPQLNKGLLLATGVASLAMVKYGIVLDEGIYITGPAVVPLVIALLGLKR